MVNILVTGPIFALFCHRKHGSIKCDNIAVVHVLTLGKTRDPLLALCARNIWLHAGLTDISVEYSHIRSTENKVADLLSRCQGTSRRVELLNDLEPNPV